MPTLGKTKVSPSLISTGSLFLGTSSYAVTASYAMNGGGGGSVQTGNIANQTILYNVTTSQDNVISGLNLSSNKWGVTVVEEWNSGSVVLDNNYNSCSLLCHFDSLNFDGRFIDNSKNNLVITSSGNVIPSPSNYKFGGASAYFNGNGSYLTISTISSNLTNDFTIECWIYIEATNISYPVVVGADGPFYIRFGDSGFGYKLQFSINDSGVSSVYSTAYTQTSLVNQWVHLALTRTSSTVRFFINGVIQSLGTGANPSSYPVTSFVNSSTISSNNWYIGNSVYNGYIDELRITKDVARYTSSFTPQTFAFPNSATQIVTKYIGLVGGLNDSNVDYGVEKLSDSSLKIRKMTASGQPLSGSGALSASVDRVYVNVLDYTNVMVTSSYALTASYVLGGIQTGSISNQTILYNVTTSQDNTITGLDLSGNKWDVSVIEEWNSASIVGDTYYNSCSLLMHFSGSNGSTTFIDNSPSPKTATANNGASISTAQSKFGGDSGLFDGSDDYVTVPDNSAFDFGAGDFTIEYWEYRTANTAAKGTISRNNTSPSPWLLGWPNAGNVTFYASANAIGWDVADGVSMGTLTTNVWTHYAVTRQGNTFRTFQNGIQISTFTSAATLYAGAAPLQIGRYNSTNYYIGYLDELRLTKGVARYTGSFVTQSAAFPDNLNVTQLQTKYVGLVGGINDSNVDYGVEKLSDGSLKIRKMSVSGQPLSGSGALSASVDRVYVNVLNYKEVQTTAQSASYAVSASYLINAASGESFHPFLLG